MSTFRHNYHDQKIIDVIRKHFNILTSTAKYLYFRGLRSLRYDESCVPLSKVRQRAIIASDRDINWDVINMCDEEKALINGGFLIGDVCNALNKANSKRQTPVDGSLDYDKQCRFDVQDADVEKIQEYEAWWQTVMNKKQKRENNHIKRILQNVGLHI